MCVLLQMLWGPAPSPTTRAAMVWLLFFCAAASAALSKEVTANDDMHADGLRPHHNKGGAEGDPLLFRHRYQHQDAATGELTYYEYEARRHAHVVRQRLQKTRVRAPPYNMRHAADPPFSIHVRAPQVMLSDIGVSSCASGMLDANHSMFTLVLPRENSTVIKSGDIIAGGELVCNRAASSSQREVREKVLHTSAEQASVSGDVQVSLLTTRAAVHECFEYSQLELFRGQAHQLHTSRAARLASAAANGHPPVKDTSASTDQILNEAAAASLPRPDESLPLRGGGAVEERRAAATRKLGHDAPFDEVAVTAYSSRVSIYGVECNPCVDTCQYASDDVCNDGGPGAEFSDCELGTDCTDCGSRMQQATAIMQSRGGVTCNCDSLKVALGGGALNSNGPLAGTYVEMNGVMRGGRAVYKQNGGSNYLYFYDDWKDWIVTSYDEGVETPHLRTVGNHDTHCPEQQWSSSWQYWSGSAWEDDGIQVTCSDDNAEREWTGCSFAPVDGSGDYPSLKPGSKYKLTWQQNDNDRNVRIKFREDDGFGRNTPCGQLPEVIPWTSSSITNKEYIFTMPDLCGNASYCGDSFAACGAGSFPEFYIELVYDHSGNVIGLTEDFRLLRTYDLNYGFTLRPEENPLRFECINPAATSSRAACPMRLRVAEGRPCRPQPMHRSSRDSTFSYLSPRRGRLVFLRRRRRLRRRRPRK